MKQIFVSDSKRKISFYVQLKDLKSFKVIGSTLELSFQNARVFNKLLAHLDELETVKGLVATNSNSCWISLASESLTLQVY